MSSTFSLSAKIIVILISFLVILVNLVVIVKCPALISVARLSVQRLSVTLRPRRLTAAPKHRKIISEHQTITEPAHTGRRIEKP